MSEEIVVDSKEVKDDVETITIGDKVININDVTPSDYFEYVKGLKEKIEYKEYDVTIDSCLKMLKKAKVTKQTALAKELTYKTELLIRELNAAKDGFDIYIDRKNVEKYIDKVDTQVVKIIDLENFTRDIPDEVVDILEKAQNHFDKFYVVFTDYTKKETKKVAKERRDKDPILFGAFINKDTDSYRSKVYVEDRLFFIADWKDETCDLTFEELVRSFKDKDGKDITYRMSNPTDEEEVKKLLGSFEKETMEETEVEPVTIFEKITKKVTKRKTTAKSKSTTTGKKRVGRPKKVKDEE